MNPDQIKKLRNRGIIINLSNLKVDDDLREKGVRNPSDRRLVQELLIFPERDIPTIGDIKQRARKLVDIAIEHNAKGVMLGCPRAQFLLGYLEGLCKKNGLDIYYPFFVKIQNNNDTRTYQNKVLGLIKNG